MENIASELKRVTDLTTNGMGADADAQALVIRNPHIHQAVPGSYWDGTLGNAKVVFRFPEETHWNGNIVIGATPAVRSEKSLDLLLSDIVLQQGYAYAACDKGTPMLVLRDPARQITEWIDNYFHLTQTMKQLVEQVYGKPARRTYISGVSNGGYITRRMLETFPDEYDGGVEWEGVYWHPESRHLLTCLPVYLTEFPVYRNFRGDRTVHEQSMAQEKLVQAGLHPESTPHWDQYFYMYWIVSLWLYGRNLDPDWVPFQSEWSNDWLKDPSELANYPWDERRETVSPRIQAIANTGRVTKPLISVAGNWDCLVPYRYHAEAYAEAVRMRGCGEFHRMFEIDRGNHVDGLLREGAGRQQAVHPFYEASLHHLTNWVERGLEPPESGTYDEISSFAPNLALLSV